MEKRKSFIVASQNKDKIAEIKAILSDLPLSVMPMSEAGFVDEIEETGKTFCENAMLKAKTVHKRLGGFVFADDSGLCIDALGGAPGVFSARFCGKDSSYDVKIDKLWELLADVPHEKRTAQFVCAIAVILPDKRSICVEEKLEGIIYDKMVGKNGFGYDPIFYLPDKKVTTAQLAPEEKNAISHRGKALKAMLAELNRTWYSVS